MWARRHLPINYFSEIHAGEASQFPFPTLTSPPSTNTTSILHTSTQKPLPSLTLNTPSPHHLTLLPSLSPQRSTIPTQHPQFLLQPPNLPPIQHRNNRQITNKQHRTTHQENSEFAVAVFVGLEEGCVHDFVLRAFGASKQFGRGKRGVLDRLFFCGGLTESLGFVGVDRSNEEKVCVW